VLSGAPAAARPPTCSDAAVESVVRDLVAAVDAGDLAAVDRAVAKRPAFKWYSVSGAPGRRTGAAAFTRTTLLRYVADRHRHGERQRLVSFRFNSNADGYGHFGFALVRSATDYRARRVAGKGAADCSHDPPRIAVWSLGA
jgi:hypothetical protein